MNGDQNDLDRTGQPLSCRAVKGAGAPPGPPVPKLLLNAHERSCRLYLGVSHELAVL